MYLGKESYEKAGLVGKPYGAKGDRKLRPRWGEASLRCNIVGDSMFANLVSVVTCDLTSPPMLHGKKGFDRLIYACQRVFDQPLTWLFCKVAGIRKPCLRYSDQALRLDLTDLQ